MGKNNYLNGLLGYQIKDSNVLDRYYKLFRHYFDMFEAPCYTTLTPKELQEVRRKLSKWVSTQCLEDILRGYEMQEMKLWRG